MKFKMTRLIKTTLAAVILATSSVGISAAETSGWIRDSDLESYMNKLGKRGLYPTKITCAEDSARTDHSVMYIKARVTSAKNPGVTWTWGIQTNTRKAERELKAQGFRLASKSTAASPNGGLLVKCVLFHRKG